MEIQYSQLKINHLNNTPSTKAAGGGIFSGVFQQGRQGTSQGQEDFELSWYLFFQHVLLAASFLAYNGVNYPKYAIPILMYFENLYDCLLNS
jgi:hypothetical protein